MTGYSRDPIIHQFLKDTDIALHKPLTRDDLEQKVRAVLNQPR